MPFTIALFLAICLSLMATAHFRLQRFRRGPLAWLWDASDRALQPRGGGTSGPPGPAAGQRGQVPR